MNNNPVIYPPALDGLVSQAVLRLKREMAQSSPFMAGQVTAWMHHLAGQAQPEGYFKHPLAFPSLLLPWWLEQTLRPEPDPLFQADLVYSTLNGYYHIRLIDNLMDGQATVELQLLPALNFFHTGFQMAYQRYFESHHPFWDFFTKVWFHSAEVTIRDAGLTKIDEEQFVQITSQKICAAKIPLAAICYRYERPELIAAWAGLVDLFGRWHQFFNDLFDWHKDYTGQRQTYFLTEAERRRQPEESLVGWVARQGFLWGIERLQLWMVELKTAAQTLGSPDLLAYLAIREQMLLHQKDQVMPGLESLARLAALQKG